MFPRLTVLAVLLLLGLADEARAQGPFAGHRQRRFPASTVYHSHNGQRVLHAAMPGGYPMPVGRVAGPFGLTDPRRSSGFEAPSQSNPYTPYGLPRGRVYYGGRFFGGFNNRFYGPQYGYF